MAPPPAGGVGCRDRRRRRRRRRGGGGGWGRRGGRGPGRGRRLWRTRVVKGVQVHTEARRAVPLGRVLDGRSLAPLGEGGDQLPRGIRADHRLDVCRPSTWIARQARRGFVRLVEPRADAVAEPSLAVAGARRPVLVPARRLVGAGSVTGEDLQDQVGTDAGVGLGPAVDHPAAVGTVAVDEHDEPATDPQVGRVAPVVITDVREVGCDLADARIRRALGLVVDGPASRGSGRGGQDGRQAPVRRAALSPP